jgi:hypothetical protein
MSLTTKLAEATTAFVEKAHGMLADPACDPQRAALLAYAEAKAEDLHLLGTTLSDPEDEPELARSLLYLWLELKSEWVRYNQVMQYQLALTGAPDPIIWYRGMVVSGVLGHLEPLFPPDHLETVERIAAAPLHMDGPIGEALDLLQQQRRSSKLIQAISQEFNSLFAALIDIRDGLTRQNRAEQSTADRMLQDMVDRFEKLFTALKTTLAADARTPFDQPWVTMKPGLVEAGKALGVRCQITDASEPGAWLEAQHIDSHMGLWVTVAEGMIAACTQDDEEQRRAAGKSLHTHLTIRLARDGDTVTLTCEDDGPGVARELLPAGQRQQWERLQAACQDAGIQLVTEARAGQGTTVVMTWQAFHYLQAEGLLIAQTQGTTLALALDDVHSVSGISAATTHYDAAGDRHLFFHQGEAYPLHELDSLLAASEAGRQIAAAKPRIGAQVVLLKSDGHRLALVVDGLRLVLRAVVQPAQRFLPFSPRYLRGILSLDGGLCLVLERLPALLTSPSPVRKEAAEHALAD